MTVTATVIYPRTPSSKFDLKYYIDQHMPLVSKTWSSAGLQGYEVYEHGVDGSGAEGPYTVQAVLRWRDLEEAKKAMDPKNEDAKKVFGDITNFSSEKPSLWWGELKGSG